MAMNLFNFSFSPTSKQTQLTQILSTIKPNQDWMDVYTTLTTIVNILKSYPANADLPLSNLTRYLIQSSDMSLPLTVHGVVLDILTLLYQRLQKNEFDCYYFYLLPPLLLLSKTSLPQIRARCVDVFQQYIISVKPKNLKETSENDLSSNDTTNEKLTPINNFVSIIETLVVCFASGLLENMNNLHEKVSILFSTINYSYPKEFCCALVHHLHRSPTTRHGLLKFIVTKKYIFSVDYVNETKLCSAFVSLLHSNDLVIVKQTLDIINEQFPMSKKTVSESIRIVLLRGVLFLLIQKDTGVIQRVTNWVFGDSESFFKENSYNTFIGTVRSIVLKYLDNPVGNGICIDTICSLVSIKLFADAIITETAGLLMKLLVVMSSTSDSSKCQSITSLLSVVDLEIFKENLETLDPKDQVIFVIHYQPSEIQTPSLITTAEILFNKYIEEFFQLHSTKANLSTLENSFITIKKIFGSLTHRLKVTVALTETSNKFKNYLNTLPYSLPEKDIKLLTNMLSFIETFSSSPDATFHTTLKDILLEEIETIHSTPAALLLCKLFLKLSASNSIYKESSKPVISFLWKQVSTSKTYLPVVVSLLASDVVEFPLDSLQDVVDYERLVVCMKLNSFYKKIICAPHITTLLFSLLDKPPQFFYVTKVWLSFLITNDPSILFNTMFSVLIDDTIDISKEESILDKGSPSITTLQYANEHKFLSYVMKLIKVDIPGFLSLLSQATISSYTRTIQKHYQIKLKRTHPVEFLIFILEKLCIDHGHIDAADVLIQLYSQYQQSEILFEFTPHLLSALHTSLGPTTHPPLLTNKLIILTRLLYHSTNNPTTFPFLYDFLQFPPEALCNPELLTDICFTTPTEYLPEVLKTILPELFVELSNLSKNHQDPFCSNIISLLNVLQKLLDRTFAEYPLQQESTSPFLVVPSMFVKKEKSPDHFFRPLLFSFFSSLCNVFNSLQIIQIKDIKSLLLSLIAKLFHTVFSSFPSSLLEYTSTSPDTRRMLATLFLSSPHPPTPLYITSLCTLYKSNHIPLDAFLETVSQIIPLGSYKDLIELLPEFLKDLGVAASAVQQKDVTIFVHTLRALVSSGEINNVPHEYLLGSSEFFQLFDLAVQKFILPDFLTSFRTDLLPLASSLKNVERSVKFFSNDPSSSLAQLVPQVEALVAQKEKVIVEDIMISLQHANMLTGKWQTVVVTTFINPIFFSSDPIKLVRWSSLLSSVYSQRLDEIWQGARGNANICKGRNELREAFELKRAAFVVLSGKINDFDNITEELIKRILVSLKHFKESSIVIQNVFLFLRVLFIKSAFVCTRKFQGRIVYEIFDIIKNYDSYDVNVLLEVLKWLDYNIVHIHLNFEPFVESITKPLFKSIQLTSHAHSTPLNDHSIPLISMHHIKSKSDKELLQKQLSSYTDRLLLVNRQDYDDVRFERWLFEEFIE